MCAPERCPSAWQAGDSQDGHPHEVGLSRRDRGATVRRAARPVAWQRPDRARWRPTAGRVSDSSIRTPRPDRGVGARGCPLPVRGPLPGSVGTRGGGDGSTTPRPGPRSHGSSARQAEGGAPLSPARGRPDPAREAPRRREAGTRVPQGAERSRVGRGKASYRSEGTCGISRASLRCLRGIRRSPRPDSYGQIVGEFRI